MKFEKGKIQLLQVDRIEYKNNNSYYVIIYNEKESWIKMYPFETQKKIKPRFIHCRYIGTNFHNSPILKRDTIEILNELYEVGMVCKFTYLKDLIDYEHNPYSLLLDEYGLHHRLYQDLSPEQKNLKQIECRIDGIDEKRELLQLRIFNSAFSDSQFIQRYITTFQAIISEFDKNQDGNITIYAEDITQSTGEKYPDLYKLQGIICLLKAIKNKEQISNNELLGNISSTNDLLPQMGKTILAYRLLEETISQKEILIPVKYLINEYANSISKPIISKLTASMHKTPVLQSPTYSPNTPTPVETNNVSNVNKQSNYQVLSTTATITPEENENIFHYILYNNNSFMISSTIPTDEDIIRTIPISEQESGFLLLCYNNRCINKVSIRSILEKRTNYRYTIGSYPDAKLIEIFVIPSDCYILLTSQRDNQTYIKIYHTSRISTHHFLSQKGNQVIGCNVDDLKYQIIPASVKDSLPQRLIYETSASIGKSIYQEYYKNDFKELRKLGLLGLKI